MLTPVLFLYYYDLVHEQCKEGIFVLQYLDQILIISLYPMILLGKRYLM